MIYNYSFLPPFVSETIDWVVKYKWNNVSDHKKTQPSLREIGFRNQSLISLDKECNQWVMEFLSNSVLNFRLKFEVIPAGSVSHPPETYKQFIPGTKPFGFFSAIQPGRSDLTQGAIAHRG